VASLTCPELAAASRTTPTSASVFSSPRSWPASSASTCPGGQPDRRASVEMMARAYSLSPDTAVASMSAARTAGSSVPCLAVAFLIEM